MNNIPLFDILPLWVTYLCIVVLILIAIWLGISFARWRKNKVGVEDDGPINTVVGATLGLLAFILAFTFGMTTSRYDARKHFMLDEVNAIETTWLRAGLIPEPHNSEVRQLLVRYVDLRVCLAKTECDAHEVIRESEEIQLAIWRHSTALVEMDHRNGTINTLFVNSVNHMFEQQTKRISAGIIDRIPPLIWMALFALVILAMFEVGFLLGKMKKVNLLLILVLAMAFSAVILIIVDLDSAKGTIQINHQTMFDLQQRLLRRM